MDNLLIFFVLPVATVILAIVLQKVLRSPVLVGATAFAIYLIVTYTAFDMNFLIYTILYTVLAFIAAYITCMISRWRIFNCSNSCNGGNNTFSTNGEFTAQNFYNNDSALRTGHDYNFYDNPTFSSISSNNNPNFEGLNYTNGYNVNNKNTSGTLYRCKLK